MIMFSSKVNFITVKCKYNNAIDKKEMNKRELKAAKKKIKSDFSKNRIDSRCYILKTE